MYPDAKLVLNVREPASWRKSVESTIMVVTSSKMYAFMIYWVPNVRHPSRACCLASRDTS